MKYLLLLISAFLGVASISHAKSGVDASVKVYPAYMQSGDLAVETAIAPSTNSVVVSTPVENANLGTYNPWRNITLVNKSTHAAAAIYFSPGYSVFNSSTGIVLSSAGISNPTNVYKTNFQGVIRAVWDIGTAATTTVSGAGMWVVKEYMK